MNDERPRDEIEECWSHFINRWKNDSGESQGEKILRDCRPAIDEKARLSHNPIEEFRSAVKTVDNLLYNLKSALWANSGMDYGTEYDDTDRNPHNGTIWPVPGFQLPAINQSTTWRGPSPVNTGAVSNLMASYFKVGWFQSNLFEWCALNGILFDEASRFSEEYKTGALTGSPNWAYIFSGGNDEKALFMRLGISISVFCLRWIVPPAVVFILAAYRLETAAFWVAGAYALYVLVRLGTFPSRFMRGRRLQQATEKLGRLGKAMVDASSHASSSVVNPSRLKVLITEAESLGAVYPSVVHSIVDRAIQRDTAVFAV